jgi:hypothetical protein
MKQKRMPHGINHSGRKVKRTTRSVSDDELLQLPADDQVFLLPWYLPKDVYLAVRRILPNIHISKMRYYFEDYGCMRCERRDVLYGTNGLCERCNVIVRWRLTQSLRKRLAAVGIPTQSAASDVGRALTLAQHLLKPFRRTRAVNGVSSTRRVRPAP